MLHYFGCFAAEKQYLEIQKISRKTLQVVYNSNKHYDELLRDNNETSVHRRHLRALVREIFKSSNNTNHEFLQCYFVFKNIMYNIGPLLRLLAAKSTFYIINTELFRAYLLSTSFPKSFKYIEPILGLKMKMKDLGNIDCLCILCRSKM